MRVVLQRIKEARVAAGGEEIGRTGAGLCLFIGVARGDTEANADYLAEKIAGLRVFEDEEGKFNRSLADTGGEILVVSEFTLYGECTKGRRPSFSQAAPAEEAERLYNYFVQRLKEMGLKVATGRFQAKMQVAILNDGPVTFLIDSK